MSISALSKNDPRLDARTAFLTQAGWGAAPATALTADASSRRYFRLVLNNRPALLMDAPPTTEADPCPPDADAKTRQDLGYNAMARLAGPNLNAFTAIAGALRDAGLSAPEIYATDAQQGFALIEDFGDDLFARAIPNGADETQLYAAAIDALIALRRAALTPPLSANYQMLSYDRIALEAEIGLVLQWYWKRKTGAAPNTEIEQAYRAAWAPVLDQLSAPQTIVLRDFHAENLLWLPDRQGPARVGLIDFQDGLYGSPAYDLVSLLEDARRDTGHELVQAMIARYCDESAGDAGFDADDFLKEYAILGAQRNAKILGIFARLIDYYKKPRYADFFPRVEAHFKNDLKHPALTTVRDFFKRHMPDLAP